MSADFTHDMSLRGLLCIMCASLWRNIALVCPFSRGNWDSSMCLAVQDLLWLRRVGDWVRGARRWSSWMSSRMVWIFIIHLRLTRLSWQIMIMCCLSGHLIWQRRHSWLRAKTRRARLMNFLSVLSPPVLQMMSYWKLCPAWSARFFLSGHNHPAHTSLAILPYLHAEVERSWRMPYPSHSR